MLTFAGFPLKTGPQNQAFSVLSASHTGPEKTDPASLVLRSRTHCLLYVMGQSIRKDPAAAR